MDAVERAKAAFIDVFGEPEPGEWDGSAILKSVAAAIRAAESAEREQLRASLERIITACRDDLATGHVPSSYSPALRMRECQLLLSVLCESK